jgi:hypothetical protein
VSVDPSAHDGNNNTSWPFLTTGWAGGQKGPTAVVFFTLMLEKKGRSPHCPISYDVCGWVRNEIALVVLCNTCPQREGKKKVYEFGSQEGFEPKTPQWKSSLRNRYSTGVAVLELLRKSADL